MSEVPLKPGGFVVLSADLLQRMAVLPWINMGEQRLQVGDIVFWGRVADCNLFPEGEAHE